MFYDNDYTSLNGGAVNIPMAEGYDCSYGAALALVDSARNDLAMFEAMLNVEAAEHRILKESVDYVQEGELQALQEASVSGLWNKIKELFSKLIAKIKAIFHTFISKLDSLFKSTKQYVNKYKKEVLRKTNIGNLEVKWRSIKKSPIDTIEDDEIGYDVSSLDDLHSKYDKDANIRFKNLFGSEESDLRDKTMEFFFTDDEPNTYQIKDSEVGGIRNIISYLEECDKKKNKVDGYIRKITNKLSKLVRDCDKAANEKAKEKIPDNIQGTRRDAAEAMQDTAIKKANETYECAVTYQNGMLKMCSITQDAIKIQYQQNKAAFVKAVSASDKKLEEEAIYLDALAEAVEDEVEDVINGALGSSAEYTNLASTSNASKAVKDADVKDDPDALIGKGYDDPTYHKDKVDGTIGANYNGKESFFNFDFN